MQRKKKAMKPKLEGKHPFFYDPKLELPNLVSDSCPKPNHTITATQNFTLNLYLRTVQARPKILWP